MSSRRAENNKRLGFPWPGLLIAVVLVLAAIVWQLLVQQEQLYDASGTLPVVTELSAQATQLPRGVVDTVVNEQALATQAADIVEALDVIVSLDHDPMWHDTALLFTATAANRDQVTAAVELSIEVYRENRERALVADAARQLESTAVERALAEDALAQTQATLGVFGELDLSDLIDEALVNVGLESLMELSGLDGYDIMTGVASSTAQDGLLEMLDEERKLLEAPDALLPQLVGETTVTVVERTAPRSLVPVASGTAALGALLLTLAAWRGAPMVLRLGSLAAVAVAVVWLLLAALEVRSIQADASQLERDIRAIDISLADLDAQRLSALADDLSRVSERATTLAPRTSGARLLPLRLLPVVSQQMRGVDQLAQAAARLTTIGSELVSSAEESILDYQSEGMAPAALLTQLDDELQTASRQAAAVETPDAGQLVDPLARATERFRREQDALVEQLEAASRVTTGLRSLLVGDQTLLLVAGNSAEIRAGQGAYLTAGSVGVSDGVFSIEKLAHYGENLTEEFSLAASVRVQSPPSYDTDMRRNHGLVQPNRLWATLGLTPRFPPTAALAADMWDQIDPASGDPVGAVIYLDSVSLGDLLRITGPIQVEDRTFDYTNIVDFVLVDQYFAFGDDSAGRRAFLRELFNEIVQRIGDVNDPADAAGPLVEAIEARRLMIWSGEPSVNDALVELGATGELAPHTFAINIASMAGKQDPFLEMSTEVTAQCDNESAHLLAEVTVSFPEDAVPSGGLPSGIDGSVRWTNQPGLYVGLAVVNAPAASTYLAVQSDGPLGGGPDGMTRQVNGWFSLRPGESTTFAVNLSLPRTATFVVPPTARGVNPTLTIGGEQVDVGASTTHDASDLCN